MVSKKMIAFNQFMNKFGILELVWISKITLSRESISKGQLITKKKDIGRRKILNSYISEI